MGLIKAIKDELGYADRVIAEAGQQGIDWWESVYTPNADPTPADVVRMRRLLASAKSDAEAINDYHTAKRIEKALAVIEESTDNSGEVKRKKFLGLF